MKTTKIIEVEFELKTQIPRTCTPYEQNTNLLAKIWRNGWLNLQRWALRFWTKLSINRAHNLLTNFKSSKGDEKLESSTNNAQLLWIDFTKSVLLDSKLPIYEGKIKLRSMSSQMQGATTVSVSLTKVESFSPSHLTLLSALLIWLGWSLLSFLINSFFWIFFSFSWFFLF